MTFDALMLALEQGGAPHTADRDLLAALQRLATDAQHCAAGEAAVNAYLSVQNSIDRLRDKKVREQRRRLRNAGERAARKERLEPTREHAARLVRLKALQLGIGHFRAREAKAMTKVQEQMPIDETMRHVRVGDLRPVEDRAVAIVCGAPTKGKKNRVEIDAIKIANAVKAEWFSDRAPSPGRPKGSMIQSSADKPDQLLSVSEVIAAVTLAIQELAGAAASTVPGSTMIAAIVAAARAAGLHCPAELASNLVRRVRRRRSST